MIDLYDKIDRLSSLLAYYENENKRVENFTQKESNASVSLSNIEADVIKFIAKNNKSDKVKDRISDIDVIRDFISFSCTVALRNESLIRECDDIRNQVMVLLDVNKKLESKIEQLYEFNGARGEDI